MAQDRGGLNYGISVKDEFSANTEKFISGIRRAKDEFAAFRAEVSQVKSATAGLANLTKASRAAAQARSSASAEEQAANKELLKQQRELKFQTDEQRRRERINSKLNAAARRDEGREAARQAGQKARQNQDELAAARRLQAAQRKLKADIDATNRRQAEVARLNAAARRDELAQVRKAAAERARLDRLNPEVQGQSRADALIQQRATAQAQLASLRSRGREDLITNQLKRQAGELRDSARSANSLLFTFRRLVGVLAVFQLARALVGGFRELIVSGVRFNDQIREAEIGITGLIVGLADVRTAQGLSVDLAQEYARAQTVARRQVELLRQDALLTTATFEQLLDTFQIAIGPGFAAGLNLDEIRKLSVSISQAATALGLPQNQLAEEIRSLLSGTIQARTTRIATALQITNADIRRLRATGELFDFLEDRFRALGLAAEQAARRTLSGIGNLVKDATTALLGQAAQPLFEELISLGNDVFDQILTIRDASGDIKPNPQAVRAFRTLFDALRAGVVQARELARELGFEGFQAIVRSLGTALSVGLQTALGIARPFLAVAQGIARAFDTLTAILNGNSGALNTTARTAGTLLGTFLLLKTAARAFNIEMAISSIKVAEIGKTLNAILNARVGRGLFTSLSTGADVLDGKIRKIGPAIRTFIASPIGNVGILLGAGGLIVKGFELVAESIFDVNLNIEQTISLLGSGLAGAVQHVITFFEKLGATSATFFKQAFTFDDAEDARLEAKLKERLAQIEAAGAAIQAELNAQINATIDDARGGTKPPPDLGDFASIISNVESVVAQANGAVGQLTDNLRELEAQFDASAGVTGAQGFAGEVEQAFAKAEADVLGKSRQIQDAVKDLQKLFAKGVETLKIAPGRVEAIAGVAALPRESQEKAAEALKLNEEEGKLLSLLRDQAKLEAQIGELRDSAFAAARLEVGLKAREAVPALRRELDGLREQATAEQAISLEVTARGRARQRAALDARNELAAQKQASAQRLADLRAEIKAAKEQSVPLTGPEFSTTEDRAREKARVAAAIELKTELEKTLGLELLIADAKEKQLAFAAEQARLAAEGTFTAGVRAGFEQLANDLPTLFDAAKNIVTGITQSFISSAGQLFSQLFDPRVQADAGVALGEFLLNAGQLIFEQTLGTLIQSLISSALTSATVETAAASTAAAARTASATALTTAAGAELAAAQASALLRAGSGAVGGSGKFKGGLITAGFAAGGRVPRQRKARGYAKGGRPRGLDPRDTIPAWLQPGEFVIRKAVVDSMGADFFRSVNSGDFASPSAPPSGEGSVGMIRGGVVPNTTPARSSGGGQMTIVPVQVTSEREMDRLQAGGKNAQMRFLRENAGTVRGILGI